MSRNHFLVVAAVAYCGLAPFQAFGQSWSSEGPSLERMPPVDAVATTEEIGAPPAAIAPSTPPESTPPSAAPPGTALPNVATPAAVLQPPPLVPASTTVEELADSDDVVSAAAAPSPKLWSGSFDLGLNGSSGNTDAFNFRFNLAAIRETDANKLTLKSNYVRLQTDGEESGNRLFFEGRHELKIGDSPWSLYAHQTTEYDEFRDWRTRIGVDGGLGYAFLKNDSTTLTARFGPSVSHQFYGSDTDWVPELAHGLQIDHQLSKRQKLFFQVDYFPAVRDFNEYRINAQASWSIVLDEVNNLSLKLSAIDRYDSTPDPGMGYSDLDYAVTLLWSF